MPESPVPHGRFAPSPSGPLHFGSIVAALASHLEARVAGGRWSLRIENIDRQRERAGAADAIVRELERLELHWDGPVIWQSARVEAYREVAASLLREGIAYACSCSRREVGNAIYPGACRARGLAWTAGRALRLRVPAVDLAFIDRLQGPYCQALAQDCGDFVVWRADGDPAYHLAVVLDDAAQAVTDVVRGADLLDSTPRQIHLQRHLQLPTPRYAHLPVALDADGRKLSKQTADTLIEMTPASTVLTAALAFLGHPPPPALSGAPPAELLAWALGHWRLANVPLGSRRATLASPACRLP